MNLPDIKKKTITIGYSGLELFGKPELQAGQIGYSVSPDGKQLSGAGSGYWNESWVVIGHEVICGDPIFIDTDNLQYPVFTAMHGKGTWSPRLIP